MRFFSGSNIASNQVEALACATFEELCAYVSRPVVIPYTRGAFALLPDKDKSAPMDRQRAKRVRYLTPATFPASPSQRIHQNAVRCNLIALDVDTAEEAKRLLNQSWSNCLKDLGYIVWHTANSTPTNPRLRIVVSAEGIHPERYVAAARTIAEMIGLRHVTSQVTFHAVQPAFLPTTFQGDTFNPIVASNAKGEPFLASEIIDDDDTAVDSIVPLPSGDNVEALEYLRQPIEGVTLDDARDALAHLDPDMPMQQWIEVAAGLKHQFNSNDAYALWDEWSAKGKKYIDSEETQYRWKSLDAQPTNRVPVTIRSLFRHAQARGWSNPALAKRQFAQTVEWLKATARSTEELFDQGAKRIAKISPVLGQLERKSLLVTLRDALTAREMKIALPDLRREVAKLELDAAKTTGLQPWAKGLCYITSLNQFFKPSTERKFAPEVLDLMFATPQIGDDKPMRPRDYAIQIANAPQVETWRYDPTQKRYFTQDGIPYVNTYRKTFAPAEPERADEAGEIFMEHMNNLVIEADYRRTLIDFLAFQVQQPGKKVRWGVLLQGAQGGGKTALAVAMKHVLGRQNVTKLKGSDILEGSHNSWAYGSQVVAIEEVRVVGHNRYAVMDKLKPCITDDDIAYHKKFESIRTVPNITNYLMFTNYQDALAVHDEDRRYFVLKSRIQQYEQIQAMGGADYFHRLFGMMRDNPGGLRAWFEQWKISPAFDADGRAPVTKYFHELVESAASPLAAAVRQAIEDAPHALLQQDLLSLSVLRASLDQLPGIADFSDQALASVLRELGWHKQDRVSLDGAKHQLWTKGLMVNFREMARLRSEFL